MTKIIFFPFLQIPSGHHHVADSIKIQLEQMPDTFLCEKIDILSYGYGKFEGYISSLYLQWIHKLPKLYSTIYRASAFDDVMQTKRFYLYELLFINFFKKLLKEEHPDVVICTHSLPSYMLARLKKSNLWSGPIINIYTDYFINNLWGIEEVDYHFVPSKKIKDQLVMQGVKAQRIFITGIPVHPLFKLKNPKVKEEPILSALLSGGNMGAGSIVQLLDRLDPDGMIRYKVLCGKNEELFHSIQEMENPLIQPLSYISSKQMMNRLYDESDLIITKPGGVTISECLTKKLPIFVYDVLPGQEEQNLIFLKNKGLVHHLDAWRTQENIEQEILTVMCHKKQEITGAIDRYLTEIELEDPVSFIIETYKRIV
ncbi:MGDG synthase family glycosyltransferase [Sporosarcina luteola]|uniref:MGDG synthase family glycosyltransferase n=1 Tax=Sporosarcina luteola TaxID=582850 RepID=UPI00203F27FD|nr:hypothetical protein [Sporosarcina luteola]MCM3709012.1 hypothetical protein [Sporosarcina luteola]